MSTFVYPTAAELKAIERVKVPVLTQDDPLFQIMPMVDVDYHILEWEQGDNFTGLQTVRGLDGQPGRVKALGGSRFRIEPGVYGEFKTIDELALTTRRQWGTWDRPVDISDLVTEAQDHLLNRRIDRIRKIGWDLLGTGTFSVADGEGITRHTDSYTLQTYNASTWGTASSATPLADFRAVQLKGRGKSTDFGARAKAYMSRVTFNSMTANTNAADLGGKRQAGLATVQGVAAINAVLMEEDLPMVVVYDDGYLDTNGVFQPFIPDNVVIVVGVRPGNAPIADYAMTRNANNPNLEPGAYTKVVDNGDREVPRLIAVHDGHNGGPRIYFPGSVCVMDVS